MQQNILLLILQDKSDFWLPKSEMFQTF
jgi:hypothetical protein